MDIVKWIIAHQAFSIYIFISRKSFFCLIHTKKGVWEKCMCVGESKKEGRELRSKGRRGNLLSLFWYIALYHSSKASERNFYFFQSKCRFHFPSFSYTSPTYEMKNCYRSEKFIIFIFNFFQRYRTSWLNSFWCLMKWEWHQFDSCDVGCCWRYEYVNAI